MPSDDGLGFYNGEDRGPVLPNPGQQGPEESVAVFQMRAFDRALKDRNLLPKCKILKGEFLTGRQDGNQGSEQS